MHGRYAIGAAARIHGKLIHEPAAARIIEEYAKVHDPALIACTGRRSVQQQGIARPCSKRSGIPQIDESGIVVVARFGTDCPVAADFEPANQHHARAVLGGIVDRDVMVQVDLAGSPRWTVGPGCEPGQVLASLSRIAHRPDADLAAHAAALSV